MANQRWDIFCKIVDNYGDIGVCWRLAKQLQVEHGLQIRLWVDNFAVAQKIIPELTLTQDLVLSPDLVLKDEEQVIENITILKWQEKSDLKLGKAVNFELIADVVIEAFACGLPAQYQAQMLQKTVKWINMEYLSAESWIADFHAKPSPQANGLIRHFYFPGFHHATGGLIREAKFNYLRFNSLKFNHLRFNPLKFDHSENSSDKNGILKPNFLYRADSNAIKQDSSSLKISLFCYANTPIADLLTALQTLKHKVILYVPVSDILLKIADFFGLITLNSGEKYTQSNLTVQILPFLNQSDYDDLLSMCDLNFVRGEDSWVRAIWAAKPFVWQPYFQDGNTHIKKLNAFLELFYADFEFKDRVRQVHESWATEHLPALTLQNYLKHLPAVKLQTLQQAIHLAQQTDFATQLVTFCSQMSDFLQTKLVKV